MTATNRIVPFTQSPNQISLIPQDLAMSFLPWETFRLPPSLGDGSSLKIQAEALPLQLMGGEGVSFLKIKLSLLACII